MERNFSLSNPLILKRSRDSEKAGTKQISPIREVTTDYYWCATSPTIGTIETPE